jgi:ketosteroid isomerase-like protein
MADEAFNRGDIDGMLAFYEEGAKILFRLDEVLTGKAAIQKALGQLLAMKPLARHERAYLIEAGDIALWLSKWSVSGTAQDGSPVCRRGSGSVVLRKGADGGWRVAIENPWGVAVLDSGATTPG